MGRNIGRPGPRRPWHDAAQDAMVTLIRASASTVLAGLVAGDENPTGDARIWIGSSLVTYYATRSYVVVSKEDVHAGRRGGLIRIFVVLAGVLGFLAVALGAFGAHALQERVPARDLEIFETGVRYQMYHALALFAVAWVQSRWPGGGAVLAGWLFVAGILIFSGSLYALVLTGARWLGAVTPVGGVAFLVGWGALVWRVLRA